MAKAGKLAYLIAAGTLVASAMPAVPQDTGDEPREIDLIEQTGRRLAQLDVSVSGPDGAIQNLTPEDFELVVGGKFIESFIVDRACNIEQRVLPTTTTEPPDAAQPGPAATAIPLGPRPTYLFYFDQHHLTPAGRQNSLDTARTIVDQLIKDGARAMVVSAGKYIATIQPLTDDRDLMQDASENVDVLTADLKPVLDQLAGVLDEAEQVISAAKSQLKGDSQQIYQLGSTLEELERASRSVREFFDYMERNPESLLRGKPE